MIAAHARKNRKKAAATTRFSEEERIPREPSAKRKRSVARRSNILVRPVLSEKVKRDTERLFKAKENEVNTSAVVVYKFMGSAEIAKDDACFPVF